MRLLILVFALLAGSLSAQQGWRPETPNAPWDPRGSHYSFVFDGKLWVFGGTGATGSGNPGDSWATSDGKIWVWQGSAGYPVTGGGVTLEFNGEMWNLGGSSSSRVSRSTDGINWTQEPDAPWMERFHSAGVVYNGKMWIFGGLTSQSPYLYALNDVWSSPDGVNWTQHVAAANWSARDSHSAVVFKNRMWILGGGDGQPLNDVWSSTDGVNWVEETANAPWDPRYSFDAVVYRDRLWVVGGSDFNGGSVPPEGYFDDAWSSADGVNWVKETDGAPWGKRSKHAAIVFNNRIWMTGGQVQSEGYQNDIWTYGLHIAPDDLPEGDIDEPYNVTFEAREGDGTFTWTLLSGQVPQGLTLNTSPSADAMYLSGTPTEDGDFPFTLQLEDNDGNVIEQDYTLTVNPTTPPPQPGGNKATGSNGAGTGCTAAPGGLPWLILHGALTLTGAVILRRRVLGA